MLSKKRGLAQINHENQLEEAFTVMYEQDVEYDKKPSEPKPQPATFIPPT